MRALLLGGAGFIGLHLARRLVREDHEVTIVDDFSRGRADPELQAVAAHPAVSVVSADLTDPRTWADLPHGWDQIYLLAAIVGVRNVERDPIRTLQVNALSALHLLDWAQPDERVFFSSTSEVYSDGVDAGLVRIPTAEDVPVMVADVTAPRFSYAISKLVGEATFLHGTSARAGSPRWSGGSTMSTDRAWVRTTWSARCRCGRCAARTRSSSGVRTSIARSATSTTPSRRCCA